MCLSKASFFDYHYFKSKQCHHKTKKSEVKKNPINNCLLCHVSIKKKIKKIGKFNCFLEILLIIFLINY